MTCTALSNRAYATVASPTRVAFSRRPTPRALERSGSRMRSGRKIDAIAACASSRSDVRATLNRPSGSPAMLTLLPPPRPSARLRSACTAARVPSTAHGRKTLRGPGRPDALHLLEQATYRFHDHAMDPATHDRKAAPTWLAEHPFPEPESVASGVRPAPPERRSLCRRPRSSSPVSRSTSAGRGSPAQAITAPIVEAATPSSAANRTGPAWCSVRAATIRASTCAGVRRGGRCGRDDRSASPASPSGRHRRTHVDRLPAHPQLLGDLTGPMAGQDTVDDQLAGKDGRLGISVGH
jgi:hypothetical protein